MDSTSRPIGICVVEDDAGFRSGLERLFSRTPDFRCLGFFASGEASGLCWRFAKALLPDQRVAGGRFQGSFS